VAGDRFSSRYYSALSSSIERYVKEEEIWTRKQELGHGSFGRVWLESCIGGESVGRLRAVKVINKAHKTSSTTEYERELEALAKLSNEKVFPAPRDLEMITVDRQCKYSTFTASSISSAGGKTRTRFSLVGNMFQIVTCRNSLWPHFRRQRLVR
jgi:serine/threonine protein kinase